MALKDRRKKGPTRDESAGFTCPHYEAQAAGKRCAHYGDGGSCDRPGQGQCVEWVKANPDSVRVTPERPAETNPVTGASGPAFNLTAPAPPPPAEPAAPVPPVEEAARSRPRPPEIPWIRQVSDDDIASFRALRVSVCLRTENVGEVWLVHEYTGSQDRFELRIDHAATLTAICAAFPGAKVSALERESPDRSVDLADLPPLSDLDLPALGVPPADEGGSTPA
ncbi:MAG: hypothetical protein FJ313_07695 [Gemmatimonadetes bacterium]|nr:hypothetical protein [Gemmatimonadota bacterium]